jgi:hypothetical protein
MESPARLRLVVSLLAGLAAAGARPAHGAPGDLLCYVPFSTVAPQDIAYDDRLDAYWVTAFLDNLVVRKSSALDGSSESFRPPLANFPTGIAYNSHDDTVLVVDVLEEAVVEMLPDGTPTERVIRPDFTHLPEPRLEPPSSLTIRGLTFHPLGDEGRGTIWALEANGTIIFEMTLAGRVLRWFPHPDDDDGPYFGGTAQASDVDLIYEAGELAGFYVTGGRNRLDVIRRLDIDGKNLGISIPLGAAGGTVSAILRRPFRCPGAALPADAFICVVESNARFAILEGGEPSFREIVDFTWEIAGRELTLRWTNTQEYERLEVTRGCETIAVLTGEETRLGPQEWSRSFEDDGVYSLTLTAYAEGRSFSPEAVTFVVGAGQILHAGSVEGRFPVDVAADQFGTLYVTDLRARSVLLFDAAVGLPGGDFAPVGSFSINPSFLGEDDWVTGIAFDQRPPNRIFLFNTTNASVGVLDDVGGLTAIFRAELPVLNQEDIANDPEVEPYYGFVEGMTFDPGGDEGRGSLWLIEANRDWIYEIDLEGRVLREHPHPYLAVEPPPRETPYGIASGGIALLGGARGRELLLSGGALRDRREVHIFRMDKESGLATPCSIIPTTGLRSSSFALEALDEGESTRIVILTHESGASRLLDILPDLPAVCAPSFVAARSGYSDAVDLTFTGNGPYDAVEILRDCASIAVLPGGATSFHDEDVEPGYHHYGVRGLRGAVASSVAETAVQVGPGAIIERAFSWPARSPQQLTRDPVDGSLLLAVNWPGDQRKVYRFDGGLRYRETRESVISASREIATLAVRVTPQGEREINYISWVQPVPLNEVSTQRFYLVKEDIAGAEIARIEISPPRPTNGFITYPTGLAWDPATDTFYYLERNSRTFVEMSAQGENLRQFPHPHPPFQNFVFNIGLDVVPERGTIFITGAEDTDHRVTKVWEMTKDGRLTGLEIPLENLEATITGISVQGDDLIAVGTGPSFSEIFRIKAFDRDPRLFVRGDADGSGVPNLADVLIALNYLFLEGPAPSCLDSLDADDSGALNLADPLRVLNYLFANAGSAPPASPFPLSGPDPTPDGLECS